MKLQLIFKAPVGSRKKDTIIDLELSPRFSFDHERHLWAFERTINEFSKTRIHVHLVDQDEEPKDNLEQTRKLV